MGIDYVRLSEKRISEMPKILPNYAEPWEGFPHILRTQQFSRPMLDKLFYDSLKTLYFIKTNGVISFLSGKRVVTYFFQPSTRTRFSFEVAAQALGAKLVSTEAGSIFSSAAKNESLEDTVRVVAGMGTGIGYADLIIIRHPVNFSVEQAAKLSRKPVINAGDGTHQHPTQSFLDMVTILLRFGRLDKLRIALVGDIRFSRTIRSLCYLLAKYAGSQIYLVSPEELQMQDDIRSHLRDNNVWFREETDLNSVLPKVDVVYFTRLQAEYFKKDDPDLYERLKLQIPNYSLTTHNLDLIAKDSIVLHPLPIGDNEIHENIKSDQRIWAFIQSDIGVAVRMALINRIFKELSKQRMANDFNNTVFGTLGWK